ncbi:MAG: cobalamin B12-binding domain-containing protein [Halanaerobium sp.]
MSRSELKKFILNNRERLVEKIMDEQLQLMPNLKTDYNSAVIKKSKSYTASNLNYLAQAVYIDEKNIFVNYYNWLYTVLKERGIGIEVLNNHLLAIKNVFSLELEPEEFKLIDQILNAAEIKLDNPDNYQQSFIKEENFLAQKAEDYLSFLLNMEREKAVQLIMDLVDQGTAIEDIYLNIFQVVQYEIGRLWQLNQISIAQEHYATSVTQLAMSQLYPKIFSHLKKGKKVLTTCIGDELHELGIRMVADLLELNGWDTIHLGSNTPINEIVNLLQKKEIDLLAISATLPDQLADSRNLIKAVRGNKNFAGIKIMAGGRLFMQSDDLWQKIGADAFAVDAKEAVKVADSLL